LKRKANVSDLEEILGSPLRGRKCGIGIKHPGSRGSVRRLTVQPPEVREPFLAAMGFNGSEFAASDNLFDPLALVRSRGSRKEP
jgi:hypothetical protein